MRKLDNPEAFPRPMSVTPYCDWKIHDYGSDGMTLLDYFAGQIAQGMAAYSGTSGCSYSPSDIAGRSYEIAEAMLRRRAEIDRCELVAVPIKEGRDDK